MLWSSVLNAALRSNSTSKTPRRESIACIMSVYSDESRLHAVSQLVRALERVVAAVGVNLTAQFVGDITF